MATRLLGPTLIASICTPDLDRSVQAWTGSLHQHVHSQDVLSAERAQHLAAAGMEGSRCVLLANELGEPWLEIIENTNAEVLDPFAHSGWFSLEIAVANVDALRATLDENFFRVIGEPANLDVSDNIRAMQVTGPAGEVLYLTEVRAEVPPFEIPFARCAVDRLFIPVMLAADRDAAANTFERLNGQPGIKFETKITVINRARGLEISQRHPVNAQQLAGSNMIEIDQLDGLQRRLGHSQTLPAGIVSISFAIKQLPNDLPHNTITAGPYAGRKTASLLGLAGERIELIE